jgi:hypothetical protein
MLPIVRVLAAGAAEVEVGGAAEVVVGGLAVAELGGGAAEDDGGGAAEELAGGALVVVLGEPQPLRIKPTNSNITIEIIKIFFIVHSPFTDYSVLWGA